MVDFLLVIKIISAIAMCICVFGLILMLRKVKAVNLCDLLEVKGFDFDTYSILKEDGYTKYYECQGVDIKNMPEAEREGYYNAFHQFIKIQVNYGYIYLSVPFHIETDVYDSYDVQNKNLRKVREVKIEKMKKLNTEKLDDKCFLIIHEKTKEEMEESIRCVESYLSQAIPLRELNEMEMLNIMQISFNPYLLERGNSYAE